MTRDAIKRHVKQILAAMLYYSGLLSLVLLLKGGKTPVILMYHRVVDDPYSRNEYTQPGIMISTRAFAAQMAFLKKHYHVLTLRQLVDCYAKGRDLPAHSAVITFDDGWQDNYTKAYPILKAHELAATIFLTTDFIGTKSQFWFLRAGILLSEGSLNTQELCVAMDELLETGAKTGKLVLSAENDFIERFKDLDKHTIEQVLQSLETKAGLTPERRPARQWTLSWNEIAAMDRNLIEFGSHGRSHQILTRMTVDEAVEEMSESRHIIEKHLGGEVISLAYPNGNYSIEIKDAARRCGYHCALAIHSRPYEISAHDLYTLPRRGVHEGVSSGADGSFSPALFACFLAEVF